MGEGKGGGKESVDQLTLPPFWWGWGNKNTCYWQKQEGGGGVIAIRVKVRSRGQEDYLGMVKWSTSSNN